MEIKGKVEVQDFTRICDLETGAVFVFCDENELMLKGYNYYVGVLHMLFD